MSYDDDSGYDLDDPKHPSYHERYSGIWDNRDKFGKALLEHAEEHLRDLVRRPRPDYDPHLDHPERYTDGPV